MSLPDKVLPFATTTKQSSSIQQTIAVTGGGDGGGGITWRIERLEKDVDEVRATLSRLEPMIVRIDEKLKHVPNYWMFIVTVLGLVLASQAIPVFIK